MNDRGREIVKEAFEEVIKNTPSFLVTREMFEEKMVELIVEECASLFPLAFTDEQYPRRIDKTIRKHFGIEV